MKLVAAAAALAAVVVLVLAGCGDNNTTTTVISTRTVTTGATGSTGASGASSNGSGTTPSGPPTRIVRRSSFQSPTGNIGCMMIGGVARCDIVKHSWSLPPRPASCPREVDFGQGLEVGKTGRGRFVCAGDTARDPSAAKLPYGTGSQVGDFMCVSRPTGVTCTNRFDGHGFLLNVQRYKIF